MLSNEIIEQLVSTKSKLVSIDLSEDKTTQEKISNLKNIIDELLDRHSNLSAKDFQILINRLQVALVDLEKKTDTRTKILDFVNNIVPK